MRKLTIVLGMLVCSIAGGYFAITIQDSIELKDAARAFESAATSCLLDVRDHSLKYDTSVACQSLGSFHLNYIEAGGTSPGEGFETQYIAESGRRMAWNAKSISAGSDRHLW
jgi:hypothetical protein